MSRMHEATIDPTHLLIQLENILESDPQMYTVTDNRFFFLVFIFFCYDWTSKMMILFYFYIIPLVVWDVGNFLLIWPCFTSKLFRIKTFLISNMHVSI